MPWRRAARALVVGVCLLGAGCRRAPANATPEGAVRELLGRMERFQGDPADAQQIFDALSGRARANLRARAERYGAASGKKIEPAAMLVPARLALRFAPHRFGAEVDGNHALVTVAGARPAQRATVAGLFEDGAWRVDLVFPELAPLQMRPGSEP